MTARAKQLSHFTPLVLALAVCGVSGACWTRSQPASADRPPVPATDSPGPSAADLDAVRGNSPINPGASPTSPDADLARGLAALRAGEVSQGVQWLEQACEQGDSLEACFELARAYRLGKGVTPDPERAQSLLEQACAGGLREACDSLGH